MPKAIPDARLDAMLGVLEGIRLHYCSAEPANYAGIAAVELAVATISGSNYVYANGDTNGRKATITPPSDTAIDTTGSCTEIAISNNVDTLHMVTTSTAQTLTSGGTVTGQAFDHELADPT